MFQTKRARIVQHLFRAAYYRWRVTHGPTIPGNDPVTGQPRAKWAHLNNCMAEREGAAAYRAMARWNLDEARALRLSL